MAKRHECSRDGCPGTLSYAMIRKNMTYCTALCRYIDQSLDVAIQTLREVTDPEAEAYFTEAYAVLVDAADKFSEYRDNRTKGHDIERQRSLQTSGTSRRNP